MAPIELIDVEGQFCYLKPF